MEDISQSLDDGFFGQSGEDLRYNENIEEICHFSYFPTFNNMRLLIIEIKYKV